MVSIPQIGEICIRSKFNDKKWEWYQDNVFQSPISGKFVSDRGLGLGYPKRTWTSFNPLDRGNLYRMTIPYIAKTNARALLCFNPLDRGNLYQIEKIVPCRTFRCQRFNSLDRGNLYQISEAYETVASEIEDVVSIPQIGEIYI